ncbi:hypothetical protein JZ751_011242 [Albula glossodonta]|uniref:Uncharacterized protein n=1 Tax=Albula glossodonta TaxID=121402 RepID=A0A8T2NYS1_9TELE|nr:hypothetical protein JZ751_011242 [Albula glossodonta]
MFTIDSQGEGDSVLIMGYSGPVAAAVALTEILLLQSIVGHNQQNRISSVSVAACPTLAVLTTAGYALAVVGIEQRNKTTLWCDYSLAALPRLWEVGFARTAPSEMFQNIEGTKEAGHWRGIHVYPPHPTVACEECLICSVKSPIQRIRIKQHGSLTVKRVTVIPPSVEARDNPANHETGLQSEEEALLFRVNPIYQMGEKLNLCNLPGSNSASTAVFFSGHIPPFCSSDDMPSLSDTVTVAHTGASAQGCPR